MCPVSSAIQRAARARARVRSRRPGKRHSSDSAKVSGMVPQDRPRHESPGRQAIIRSSRSRRRARSGRSRPVPRGPARRAPSARGDHGGSRIAQRISRAPQWPRRARAGIPQAARPGGGQPGHESDPSSMNTVLSRAANARSPPRSGRVRSPRPSRITMIAARWPTAISGHSGAPLPYSRVSARHATGPPGAVAHDKARTG